MRESDDMMLMRHAKSQGKFFTSELLAELGKTVTPAEARVQKSLKNLVPGLRRDDEKDFCKRLEQLLFDFHPRREVVKPQH